MCVIVHLAAKQTIDKTILQNCYDNNRDGWGIMWNENGKLWYVKELSSFNEFMKAWKQVPRHAERGIHFRIKTHGLINSDNCHPFVIDKSPRGVAMMHNGTISGAPLIDAGMSDTHNFVKYEVNPIVEDWEGDFMVDETFRKVMEEASNGSRLLFIDSQGQSLRCRESSWHKQDGIYFSNQYSLNKRYSGVSSSFAKLSTTVYGGGSNVSSFRGAGACGTSSDSIGKSYTSSCGYDPKDESDYPFDEYGDWSTDNLWNKQGELNPQFKNSLGNNVKRLEDNLENNKSLKDLEPKSDLYAGNKTDAEGKEYIDNREAEQLADMEAERLALEEELRSAEGSEEVVNPFPPSSQEFEEDADDTMVYWNIEEMLKMDYDDLLECVETFPQATVFTLKGLLDACVVAGVTELPVTQLGLNALNEQEAVG